MTETQKLPPLPMPNDEFDGATVIASCWQKDDWDEDGEPWYTLLLLNPDNENGFYRVVEVVADSRRIYQDDPYPNIIPAAAAYSAAIGGF